MANAYPASSFVTIDIHPATIETVRDRVSKAGLSDRIKFEVASSADHASSEFDLICFMECLHDMDDPMRTVAHTKQA